MHAVSKVDSYTDLYEHMHQSYVIFYVQHEKVYFTSVFDVIIWKC